jgi:hypothetical protein
LSFRSDSLRYDICQRKLQAPLQLPVLELDERRQRSRELDDVMIDQRGPRLEAVRHAHAILYLEERRQQRLEVEVRHPVEVRIAAHVRRTEDTVKRLLGGSLLKELRLEDTREVVGAVDEPEVAAIQVIEDSLTPEGLTERLVLPQRLEVRDDRFVGHDERSPVGRSVDRRPDALFEIGEQVPRVPAEDLVSALAAEHDLALRRSRARDDELRERPRSGYWVVEVIEDPADLIGELVRSDRGLAQRDSGVTRDLARV